MPDNDGAKRHSLTIKDRSEISITGVSAVIAFDEGGVVVNTCEGKLCISGSGLHVGVFDEGRGELNLTGHVDSIKYSENHTAKNVTGRVIKRMFG